MPGEDVTGNEERYRHKSSGYTDAEAFFTGVLNSLYEHVAVIERDGLIVAVNDAWRNFARQNDAKSPSAVSEGVNYLDVCRKVTEEHEEYARQAIEGIRDVIEGRREFFTMEYPCSSPSEERWFLMNVVPLQRPEGGAVVSHMNITRRRRAEEELRESREEYRDLSRKLITAREDARRRLARDLHDSFGQRLALISMLAGRMEIDSCAEDNLKGLKRIQEETSQLSRDVHDISRQLHPRIIEDLGLADAVASFCASFAKNESIPVEFNPGEIPLEIRRDTALNFYRIIQESMSNAARHAKAGRIKVDLDTAGGSLRLKVTDDGTGFDPEEARKKKRMGLVSLRERAAIVGGNIRITSLPGEGTTVAVEAPLEPAGNMEHGEDHG
jgi:signal transduction histidine kinase